MIHLGGFLLFLTTGAGMIIIPKPAIAAAFMVMQILTAAVFTNNIPLNIEPEEKIEQTEKLD